eukprot:11069714-Prorocentrum_lima.AAC.1
MTSSLVGSEMCIRDRICTRLVGGIVVGRPTTFRILSSLFPVWRGSPSSVSYTHLTLPTICSV